MVPIAGSCRAHCRMFSSCLICPSVPLSGSVRLPAVSSPFRRSLSLIACLVPSYSLARLASLLVSLLAGRDGSAMGVGSVCDYGGCADVVRMSFSCLLLGSLASRLCPSPRLSTRVAGRGASVGIACFSRISPAMRGFCGSRSLRLPGLLPHGILFSCRRGRMSAIAVHRDSLACFSIPIFLSAL